MSTQRAITSPAEALAANLGATEARTSALEVVAHQHPGRVGGVFLCTSGTRPGNPSEGFTVYETDTNVYSYWDGSAWVTLIDTLFANNVQTIKQTTQQTNSSNVTPTDSSLLFSVVSGTMYHFKFMGLFQSAATNTGIGFAFSGPATTYCSWTAQIETAAAGTDSWYQASATALTTVLVSPGVAVTNTSYPWETEGFLQPSANGTLRLRFRSETNAVQVTLVAGSMAILTRIG